MTAMIVIAKSPVAGRVKTRLCPPCTPEQAASIARASLRDSLDTVGATAAGARVLALDGHPGPWIPSGYVIVPQMGNGLDERLANAFAAVTGPAVLIGMDTPQVTAEMLDDCMARLDTPGVDAVLAPALDGGWWAIGLRAADPRVFVGVPMSTAHTFDAQLARLRDLGLRTNVLVPLVDVDTFDDALTIARDIPASRFAAAVAEVERQETVTRPAG